MNILIKKKTSELITPETINFTELVKNSKTTLSLSEEYKSEMIELLNKEFSEEQQKWYIANLFAYLHFHPTNDFPVNLEHVYKDLGFANKGNAMKTIKSNFNEGENYKIVIFRSEKNLNDKDLGGRPTEDVLLNIDTYKTLCMLVKTDKGKEIRKYYVKLENIYNQIIKKEIDNKDKLLKEKDNLLLKEKENTIKLLEEKDKYIAQLKEEEISFLYIGHNPKIKNITKFGINTKTKNTDVINRQESHKSSNPDYELLFTYETKNSKIIEDFIKLLLKPYKYVKPEWISISYERMKQVVDFAIMMYDNYHIDESVDNLIEFISRYRSNRLINTNKARIIINKDLYEEWFKENSIMIPNAKISTELICNDFYEWYKNKYPEKIDLTHIKLETGNWSTFFQKEITNTISNITKLEYKQGISFSDRKRGIYFPKCAGFIGFELKSMNKKLEYFDKTVYEKYVNDFMKITNNPRHKVARVEILDDFLIWVKNNNYPTKNRIMCRTAISSIFKDVLIENLENILGLKIQDVCKINYNGCFVGVTHSKFPFVGNETCSKVKLTDDDLMKKQIDSWSDINNNTNIAKIFKKIIINTKISQQDIKTIMNHKHMIDITLNTRKTNWHLVFKKDNEYFYLLENALQYYNSKLNKK